MKSQYKDDRKQREIGAGQRLAEDGLFERGEGRGLMGIDFLGKGLGLGASGGERGMKVVEHREFGLCLVAWGEELGAWGNSPGLKGLCFIEKGEAPWGSVVGGMDNWWKIAKFAG